MPSIYIKTNNCRALYSINFNIVYYSDCAYLTESHLERRIARRLFVFCLILLYHYSVPAIKASETVCLLVPGFLALVYLVGVVSAEWRLAPRGSASADRLAMARVHSALSNITCAHEKHRWTSSATYISYINS